MGKSYTFEELLNSRIYMMTEDKNHYYIKLDTDYNYDDSLWVVDKKSKNVSYMSNMEYVFSGTHDNTKPVDPETLRRVSA